MDFWPPSFLDFDSTRGFPGEGPLTSLLVGLVIPLAWLDVVGAVSASHGDAIREMQREGLDLPGGRRVTALTSSIRSRWELPLMDGRSENLSLERVFIVSPPDYDKSNSVLTRYGRYLFSKGKPYCHRPETINLVSSERPVLRRGLQQAWELCAMGSSYEPVEHHVQLLLAVLSACLVWGWTRKASFALCWGMFLRPGELVNAMGFQDARHQSSKLEPADLIDVAWIELGKLKPHELIWPFSLSTRRHRLDKTLLKLGLPIKTVKNEKPLTLASFRPGGTTYLINQPDRIGRTGSAPRALVSAESHGHISTRSGSKHVHD